MDVWVQVESIFMHIEHNLVMIHYFSVLTVNFSIHSKRSCPDTDSRKLGDAILKAFDDMRALYNA